MKKEFDFVYLLISNASRTLPVFARNVLCRSLLIAVILIGSVHVAYGQATTIDGGPRNDYTNNGNVIITKPHTAEGILVTFTGTTKINAETGGTPGNLIFGEVYYFDLGTPYYYPADALFNGGTATIAGSVYRTNIMGASLRLDNNAAVTIGGNLGTVGPHPLNVSMDGGTTLRIVGDLGGFALINMNTGSTLGVCGNIINNLYIHGSTLQVAPTTTGLNNVTVSSNAGSSRITTYEENQDLHFDALKGIPNITLGANSMTLNTRGTLGGSITFANPFSLSATSMPSTIAGSGDLVVQANGTDKNLTFTKGIDLNFGVNTGNTSLWSTGGSVTVGTAGTPAGFTYNSTGSAGNLAVSAGNDVDITDQTTITQSGLGLTTITATNGSITHTGAYSYSGVNGGLTETAGDNLAFNSGANIQFTGSGNTELTSTSGTFLSGNFTYSGTNNDSAGDPTGAWGNLTIKANGNATFTGTNTITQAGNDNTTITSATGSITHTGATTITQTGTGSTTITAPTGSITHTGTYNYSGVNGALTEIAGSNLAFGSTATINYSGTGNTVLQSTGGDFSSTDAFLYANTTSGVGSDLAVSGRNVTFGSTTTITQQDDGATVITATATGGGITNKGAFTYSGENGALTMTARKFIKEEDIVTISHTGTGGSGFTATEQDATIEFGKSFSYTAENGDLFVATGSISPKLLGKNISFGSGDTDATTINISGTGKTEIYTYDSSSDTGLRDPTGGSVTFKNVLTYDGTTGDFKINAGDALSLKRL